MNGEFNRGEIYYADLPEELVGSEQAGIRPVVIIQTKRLNDTSTNVIFAIITSKTKRLDLPCHYLLPKMNGLPKRSMVEGEHVHTMDKSRLGEYCCTLSERVMKYVDRAVRAAIKMEKSLRNKRKHRHKKKSRMQKSKKLAFP